LIKDLPDNFLVMNGDILTDLDFRSFYKKHVECKNIFTISSYQREIKSEFGVLDVDNNNILVNFREKPVSTFEVSMGVYMLSKKSIDYIPSNIPYGFDHLMLNLIKNKAKPKVYKFDGYWMDIGRPDDYSQAIDEFDKMREKFIL
jgi:NDP-sugar pyrophosphorylase family protein